MMERKKKYAVELHTPAGIGRSDEMRTEVGRHESELIFSIPATITLGFANPPPLFFSFIQFPIQREDTLGRKSITR